LGTPELENQENQGWLHGVVVTTLVSIIIVALHRAELLLGRLTVCWQVNHRGMYPNT